MPTVPYCTLPYLHRRGSFGVWRMDNEARSKVRRKGRGKASKRNHPSSERSARVPTSDIGHGKVEC